VRGVVELAIEHDDSPTAWPDSRHHASRADRASCRQREASSGAARTLPRTTTSAARPLAHRRRIPRSATTLPACPLEAGGDRADVRVARVRDPCHRGCLPRPRHFVPRATGDGLARLARACRSMRSPQSPALEPTGL